MPLDGPRLVVQLLLAGDAVQDDPQVPVAQAVSEEQEVALAELGGEGDGHEVREIRARQVVDVVIFGDHVAVGFAVGDGAVDRAVDLEDDRSASRATGRGTGSGCR